MKTFTFKYDPSVSIKGMFQDLKKTMKGSERRVEEDSIVADSIDAIFTTMTRARLDLFYCVAKEKPSSLYQLAQLLGRDQANVLRDTKVLDEIGLIELEQAQEGERERLVPHALYDRIIFDFGAVSHEKSSTPSAKKKSSKKAA